MKNNSLLVLTQELGSQSLNPQAGQGDRYFHFTFLAIWEEVNRPTCTKLLPFLSKTGLFGYLNQTILDLQSIEA